MGPCQTSMPELFAKIVNRLRRLKVPRYTSEEHQQEKDQHKSFYLLLQFFYLLLAISILHEVKVWFQSLP